MSEVKKFEAPKLEKDEPASAKGPGVEGLRREKTAVKAGGEEGDSDLGRRRVPRRAIENRVGILFRGQYAVGWAHEIGEGGISISGPIDLKQGDRIVLTLKIPDAIEGVITGTVMYAVKKNPEESRFGIKFDDIDFDHKRKIRHFVASGRTYIV